MTAFLRHFARDETGAAAAEYTLILALMGAGIALAAYALGGRISGAMERVGDKMGELNP